MFSRYVQVNLTSERVHLKRHPRDIVNHRQSKIAEKVTSGNDITLSM